MGYSDIFSFPSWEVIGLSVLQTTTLFCLIFVGLRFIGRRVLAEKNPQDLVTLILVAEACNVGLSNEEAGYWGSFFSVVTIFILGYSTEKITFIRRFLNQRPLTLYSNDTLNTEALEKNMLDKNDLNEMARQRGYQSYTEFQKIVLEGDGAISGIEKKED